MTTIPRERIPKAVFEVSEVLERGGERAWIVGGCLRDLLLGRDVADWDLATSATPQRVTQLFPRTIPTGIDHGTVTVVHKRERYEVTTLRGEGAYSDGRRPDSVTFVDDITRDLQRRDFTVNALAYELATGAFVDPFGGNDDLTARLIRAVRDPLLRFSEDGLRVLRAARFAATLEFDIEPDTRAAIRPTLDVLARVSRERVRDEWQKAMKARSPSRAFEIMRDSGILAVIAPTLALVADDPWRDAMWAMDHARDPGVRLASLCSCLGFGSGPAEIASQCLGDLRYSNDERKLVSDLLTHGDPPSRGSLDRSSARRFFRSVGRARLPVWLIFLSAKRTDDLASEAAAWNRSVEEELGASMVFDARDLAIRGDEVARLLGGPGPAIRLILDGLLAFVDEDPARNTHATLLAQAVLLVKARA